MSTVPNATTYSGLPDNSSAVKELLEKANDHILPSSRNFYTILTTDNYYKNIFLDTMRMQACRVLADGGRIYWEDADDALSRMHLEDKYGLRSAGKTNDAFLALLSQRKYSPIQERIKAFVWDGKPHCEHFFVNWQHADDTPYTKEVSRLHFRQSIARAFRPGCKADNVIVLKGKQGCGKSTLCAWLALEDSLYASVRTLEGQKGYEAIQGKYVCELEEMLATLGTDTRKEEAVKGFISGTSDHYRRPFDRRSSDNPRTCIFIGTTNRDRFLSDPTGNRRWFPIECRLTDECFVFDHEEEIKADIEQCYAEMYYAWNNNLSLASPVASSGLMQSIRERQESSELEDYRIGMIEAYLKKAHKEMVCIAEVWENGFGQSLARQQLTRSEANSIGELLRLKIGCTAIGKRYFSGYGTQHAYKVPDKLING